MKTNTFYTGDSNDILKKIPDNFIDLTVTSPPYDGLRLYNGFTFDWKEMIGELYRVTKKGGVVVWIVNDGKVKGSRTGTCFRQALHFKASGFNFHDSMIWKKSCVMGVFKKLYYPIYDFMFIFSKGPPTTFNPIIDRENSTHYNPQYHKIRRKNGEYKHGKNKCYPEKFGKRFNIWRVKTNYWTTSRDKEAYEHPAIFPEDLVKDHILSWSNPGDIVLDPMVGSGTTAKMAVLTGRKYIGIDISKDYIAISKKRVEKYLEKSV